MSDLKTELFRKLQLRPDLLPEVFAFAPDSIKEYAAAHALEAVMARVTLADSVKYHDRLKYLTKNRAAPKLALPRCGSKVTYTKALANNRVNEIHKEGRGTMRAYQCHLCDGWHLTHKEYIEP